MAPILYDMGVGIFIRQLKSLREILEKGESWLKEKDLPEETLIESRLAPDMFPLKFQVQTCCDDSAKLLNRMIDANIEPPPRDEKTFAELYARIEKALSWLEDAKPEAFEGQESKDIIFMSGSAQVRFNGWTYLQEIALPNILFHKTTAYALLRREGVQIGKFDFIGVPSKGMELKA